MTAEDTIHTSTTNPDINSVNSRHDYEEGVPKTNKVKEIGASSLFSEFESSGTIPHSALRDSSNSDYSVQSILYPLLYSAILENLNTQLAAELPSPLDSLYEDENTHNPDLFAELMLSNLINLFIPFSEQHPELCESVILDQFLNIISEGINNGIADTKEILDHNYSLESTTNTQIEQVNDKLYEGLEEYCYTFGYSDSDNQDEKEALYSEQDNDSIISDELLDRLRM